MTLSGKNRYKILTIPIQRDGQLALYDVNSLEQPLALLSRSSSSLKSLKFLPFLWPGSSWDTLTGPSKLLHLTTKSLVCELVGKGTGAADGVVHQEKGSLKLVTEGRLGLLSSYSWPVEKRTKVAPQHRLCGMCSVLCTRQSIIESIRLRYS